MSAMLNPTVDGPIARRLSLRQGPLARFERMVEIRRVEDRVLGLFAEGLIPGTTHTCQGQEAVSVAIATATEPTDQVTCTYRGHGTALSLGMEVLSVVGEVLGRTTGSVGGLGGSMHLADPDIGLLRPSPSSAQDCRSRSVRRSARAAVVPMPWGSRSAVTVRRTSGRSTRR